MGFNVFGVIRMLSIIIPTLNEEKYIGNLLECLKKQTFKDFEVMIIDGNSKDRTIQVINKNKKNLKLRIIDSKKRNISLQRNIGANKAKYNTLLFMDADNNLEKNFLEKLIKRFKASRSDIAGCLMKFDNSDFPYPLYCTIFNTYLRFMWFRKYINGCCIIIKKGLHKKIGGFNPRIKVSEDLDYSSRAAKYGKASLFTDILVTTSPRRFEREGLIIPAIKYVAIAFYIAFIGKITKNIFNYRFGHYRK